MLTQQRRQQLDGLVQQMASQNAPQEDVHIMVNDFLSKYGDEKPSFSERFGSDLKKGFNELITPAKAVLSLPGKLGAVMAAPAIGAGQIAGSLGRDIIADTTGHPELKKPELIKEGWKNIGKPALATGETLGAISKIATEGTLGFAKGTGELAGAGFRGGADIGAAALGNITGHPEVESANIEDLKKRVGIQKQGMVDIGRSVSSGLTLTPSVGGQAAAGVIDKLTEGIQNNEPIDEILAKAIGAGLGQAGLMKLFLKASPSQKPAIKSAITDAKKSEVAENIASTKINKLYPQTFQSAPKGPKTGKTIEIAETKRPQAFINTAELKDKIATTSETGETVIGKNPSEYNFVNSMEANEQTMKHIFDYYDDLQKRAGGTGLKIKSDTVLEKLAKDFLDNPVGHPDDIKLAQKLFDWVGQKSEWTPSEMNDIIKRMNEGGKYGSSVPKEQAIIYRTAADEARKALDTGIKGATGEEYQALKDAYSANRSIQDDLFKAAMKEISNKPELMQKMADWYAVAQTGYGLVSGDLLAIARGVAGKGGAKFLKWLNSPQRKLSQIWKIADEYITKNPRLRNVTMDYKAPLLESPVSGKPPVNNQIIYAQEAKPTGKLLPEEKMPAGATTPEQWELRKTLENPFPNKALPTGPVGGVIQIPEKLPSEYEGGVLDESLQKPRTGQPLEVSGKEQKFNKSPEGILSRGYQSLNLPKKRIKK